MLSSFFRRRLLRDLKERASSFSEKHVRFASTGKGRLAGKIAVITGGASGLGKATAEEFIRNGAKVILADCQEQLGNQTAKELGSCARFIPCDVTHEQQIADAVDFAISEHGQLDIMCNGAGITGSLVTPSIADLDLVDFDLVMSVNVRGTIAGIKHAARVMIPRRSGSILCMASISGIMGGLGTHPYTVSKFTIPGIVKSTASELCRYGIRANCISPFVVLTPMVVEQLGMIYPSASREKLAEIVNGLGELNGTTCEEGDIARAAAYLASEDAKYVSGHNLVVDGGFTCFKQLGFPNPEQIT